ncbi:hypothetical protein [Rhizobium sp. NRK18]|uniref:hypothetical protein n=1 Tax=Rhizobium sp. NRK18 TaxID=2964667 RepID=UPI0021C4A9D1|nr:hypothetical protein [Rhizobium sp. NRK18]MCQ2005879.1 hypothetical protein [Rhizobium sp. NRK18]
MEKRRLRQFAWRKPEISNAPRIFPRSALECLRESELQRFNTLAFWILISTLPCLILLQVLDGRWWMGQIDGLTALGLSVAMLIPYFSLWVAISRILRLGILRARDINSREAYTPDFVAFTLSIKTISKLVLLLAMAALLEASLFGGVRRLFRGLPFSDPHAHHHFRRWQIEFIDQHIAPYFPSGPIFPAFMMLAIAVLIFWLIFRVYALSRQHRNR